MSPLQAARGMIVRDSKTGRRYEVLGLGRRPGTLRLLDLEKREVWYNASAQWYEPTGQRIEDVQLPEPEVLRNLDVEIEFCDREYEPEDSEF